MPSFQRVHQASSLLSIQALFHLSFLILTASFLTVWQSHTEYPISSRLLEGAGGIVGQTVGGTLYSYFGLYGALMILVCSSLIIGIISGYMSLVHAFMEAKEHFYNFLNYLLQTFKKSLQYFFVHLNHLIKKCGLDIDLPIPFLIPHPQMPENKSSQTHSEHSDAIKDQSFENSDAHTEDEALESLSQEDRTPEDSTDDLSESAKPTKPTTNQQKEQEEKSLHITVQKWTKVYKKPDISLLTPSPKKPKPQNTKEICENLEKSLASFQIKGQVIQSYTNASLSLYEFQPSPGVKVSKITKLTDDLALLLGARAIRILAPIPGKTTIGIEVPNKNPYQISFRDMIKSLQKNEMQLPIALGMDVHNHVMIEDLQAMPHLLVSGTTGSGKSVFINIAINSLLFKRSPKHLRLLMIDPKMIELTPYNKIPHLLHPVVTDLTEAKNLLCWAEKEMDLRYKKFADLHTRNIISFNETIKKNTKKTMQRRVGNNIKWDWVEMPYIVVIIDELADLMITQGRLVETPITRIAQKARACGIHLIIATQRPSTDIVTGLIKTNFPTRIAFKVSSSIDSRTILDTSGAEKLLGKGDMLFLQQGGHIDRLQGCFLSETDIRKINDSLKS